MLVGRTGLSPVMVGRSSELDRLADLLGTRSAPTVALVAGEAGIGKTRLIQELVSRATADTVVLTGQADPDAASRPLSLLVDAVSGLPPQALDGELAQAIRDCERPTDERIAAAVEAVQALVTTRPGLLVFEDIHWSDAESLAVLERLAEPESGRLLLVSTYRPDALSRRHPASELLPRLERRHSVTHIRLQRLEPADVGIFLNAVYGEVPSFRVVNDIYTRTGGNPFFLEELIASSGTMPDESLDTTPLPWSVTELVRAQVDDLDPEVRRIVVAAAELGRRVPFDVLAVVTGTTEDQLIERLRVAVDTGLLLETEPDVFGFHHEIAREAIVGGMLGRERRRLHERALDALRQAGTRDHAALARHAMGASRFEEMIEEARLGAHESLARGSSYQALQLAECGLSEAEGDVDLLSVAARSAWLAGLVEDAAHYADQLLDLARRADDVSHEANALSLKIRMSYEVGDLEAMAGYTHELADVVDRLPTDEDRAQAMAALAQSFMLRDKVARTVEWADKAYELAAAHGLTSVRIAAMVEKGSAMIHDPATSAEAQALLEEAEAEASRLGDHVLAARALNNLMWKALGWSDVHEVRKLIERQRSHAKAAGWVAYGHHHALAQLAAIEGDIDAAIAQLDDEKLPGANRAWKTWRWTAILRAGYALEVGDLETAARSTAEAMPSTDRTAASVAGLQLHLAARRGDLDEARRHLPDLLAAVRADGFAGASSVHDILAAALRAGLGPDELRPLVELVGSYVGHRLDPSDPWRQLLDAQLAEAEGRTTDAGELYLAAVGKLGSDKGVLAGHRGTAHVRAARSLIARGRLDEARTEAEAAARHLQRWRGWRVDELRAVQRRLGLGQEPSGPAALTPREREVAALLAEGCTNSQVAERLYISPRTAAVHVSNILAKLGMSSRTEIAAWAAAGGLDPE